jgi:type VI secretion system protein ImpL
VVGFWVLLALVYGWPWWFSITVILVVATLVLGALLAGKVWQKYRERNFAGTCSQEELARIKAAEAQHDQSFAALEAGFKAAVTTLRNSRLSQHARPLYALPWYLVIGSSGSGKSTALRSARLPTPLSAPHHDAGPGFTPCAWWFLDGAVFIETPGSYTMPAETGVDARAWQKLLSLLTVYRRKEPLNGIIVTVAADLLFNSEAARLEREAVLIRNRLDEAMRAAGSKIPVYLLITKCDLIAGLATFCSQLPAHCLDQPMGSLFSSEPEPGVGTACEMVLERLKQLRLLLVDGKLAASTPELLALPAQFTSLTPGVVTFARHAFGTNPYQETPLLRGIFFGAGLPEPDPDVPQRLQEGGSAGSPCGKPLFLHEFFTAVLPADRCLPVPTRRSLNWHLATARLGVCASLVLGLALCGLLTCSFVHNLQALRAIARLAAANPAGNVPPDLTRLEQFRQEIVRLESEQQRWWLPHFGLAQSSEGEQHLKELYCKLFLHTALEPMDRNLASGMALVTAATPDDVFGNHLLFLARRVNLLKARLHGERPEQLQARPQPDFSLLAQAVAATGTPTNARSVGVLYRQYLLWSGDPGSLRREVVALQASLDTLLAIKGRDLKWAAAWVNSRSGLPAVTLKDFWGGSETLHDARSVPPAYSRKGEQCLAGLVAELTTALAAPAVLAEQQRDFTRWYQAAVLESWRAFAADFARGAQTLHGARQWQQAAALMPTENGPFFALSRRLTEELGIAALQAPAPLWLQQLARFDAIRAAAAAPDSGLVKATEKGKVVLTSIRKSAGQEAGAQRLETELGMRKAGQEYLQALSAIVTATRSRKQACDLAALTLNEEPGAGSSPCHAAAGAASRLSLGMSGTGTAALDPILSQLVRGPLDFLWRYLLKESAAYLQTQWEEQVLSGTLGMNPQQATPLLLGVQGSVWRFANGPAAPFLTRTRTGYRAREVLGGAIAFEQGFLSYLANGAVTQATLQAQGRQQSFAVGITGLPTDSNADATLRPQATRLELQCGGSTQSLVNNNYPVAKTLSWSPESCGDVTLQIEVGDVMLTKHYLGPQGFPDFLSDLRSGKRTFAAAEFPGEQRALERIGVKFVRVNYRLTGSGAVLKQAASLAVQPPRTIARGWDH